MFNLLPLAVLISDAGFVYAHSSRAQLTSSTFLKTIFIGFFTHARSTDRSRLDAAGGPAATMLLAHASARNFVDDPPRKRTPQRRRSAPGVDAREVNESRKRLLTLVSLVSGRRV